MRELDALRAECERAEATLRAVPDDAWTRPALGEWDLHTLSAHLTRTIGRLGVYLDEPAPDGGATVDRVGYYRYDPATIAAGAAARARTEAAALPPDQLPAAFARTWRTATDRAAASPATRVLATPLGALRLDHYVATRCVEAVVHHMDLRRALDLPPVSDPDAAAIAVAVLEGLLDGPRPRNLGRDRFILVATGRIPHDDPRFPVLG